MVASRSSAPGSFLPLHRVGVFAGFAVPMHHGVEGFGDALPAAVAVHGVVAATARGDLAGVVLTHLLLELLKIAGAASRESVATIHKGMHKDILDAILFGHLQQCVK